MTGARSAWVKVCKTCGQTSAQVIFPRMSQSACTPCDAERKRDRNSRISARGVRVVSAAPAGRLHGDNPKHLAWVRCQPCAARSLFCQGEMHAHHVRTADNAGTGCKPADTETVPLCAGHHAELHGAGVRTFEARYGLDLATHAGELAGASPHVAGTA